MTVEEFKALPVGTIVTISYDDPDTGVPTTDPGEILASSPAQVTIFWCAQGETQSFDPNSKAWQTFVSWLEVEK